MRAASTSSLHAAITPDMDKFARWTNHVPFWTTKITSSLALENPRAGYHGQSCGLWASGVWCLRRAGFYPSFLADHHFQALHPAVAAAAPVPAILQPGKAGCCLYTQCHGLRHARKKPLADGHSKRARKSLGPCVPEQAPRQFSCVSLPSHWPASTGRIRQYVRAGYLMYVKMKSLRVNT